VNLSVQEWEVQAGEGMMAGDKAVVWNSCPGSGQRAL